MWTERRSALGVLLLTLAAFLPSLQGSFVWDDAPLIADNPAMQRSTGFVEIVSRDLWGQATGASTQLYHPVPMLSIWAQVQLFGLHMVPLRTFNLMLHLLVVWSFVQLLKRLGLTSRLAWLAGLLVALHPSVCEPVMWITGRHDTVAMLLLMAALACWPEPGARGELRALGSGSCLALAFLSKEPYIVGPVLLAFWVGARHALAGVRPSLRSVRLLALAGLPLLAALALRRALGISTGSAQLHASVLQHAQNYASLVWHYGSQLVSLRNGLTIAPFVPLTAAGACAIWLLLVAASVGLGFLARRDPRRGVPALFGWSWFLIALSPHVISVPSIGLYGNRYAYCALFGLASCCVSLLDRWRLPERFSELTVALLGVALALELGLEATAWHDNRTLYLADALRAPDNGYALYHLGTAVLSEEGCSAALPLFVRATELAPRYDRPFHNAAGCLINLGRAAEAQPYALQAVRLSPYDARSRHNLALSELARGRPEAAREQLAIALRLRPHYAPAERTLSMLDARSAGSR